jgi:hypothetical protein
MSQSGHCVSQAGSSHMRARIPPAEWQRKADTATGERRARIHTHTRTRAHTHTRTHTHTPAHTHRRLNDCKALTVDAYDNSVSN